MGLSFESASALRFAQKPGARRATGPIVGERAATGQTVQLLEAKKLQLEVKMELLTNSDVQNGPKVPQP